jgi:hypothetical protein
MICGTLADVLGAALAIAMLTRPTVVEAQSTIAPPHSAIPDSASAIPMELTIGNLTLVFQLNDAGRRYVAPITLPEWEPFRSTSTAQDVDNTRVLLECSMSFGGSEVGKLADRSRYLRSLDYFMEHRAAIQESVLAASLQFVKDLHAMNVHYEVESRVALAHVASVDDL